MQLRITSFSLLIVFLITIILGTVLANRLTDIIEIGSLYDSKRFLALLFIWFTVLFLCTTPHLKILSPTPNQGLFLLAIIACIISSLVLSEHPYWSGVELANMILLGIIFLCFYTITKVLTRLELVSYLFFFAVCFSALHFFVYLLYLGFSYLENGPTGISNLISGYDNVRFFNQLQVMIYPLLSLVVFFKSLHKYRKIAFILASLHCLALLQTEARGAVLSLFITFNLINYFSTHSSKKLFASFVTKSFAIGFVLWLGLIVVIPSIFFNATSVSLDTSSSGRLELWLYAVNSIFEQPWFGFGPMSFAWGEGRPIANAHLHNSLLQVLYEYGIPMFLVTLSLIFLYFKQALSQLSANHIVLESVLFSVLSAAIYSLFSGVIVMPFSQLLLIFLVAVGSYGRQYSDKRFITLGKGKKLMLCILTTILVGVVVSSFQHSELKKTQHPRVWIDGAIDF
ncbi:O-antigen ligase family protein [Shewanella intestini]|uniref:O-antigen ligase family protein n=1 Tax=Shewanella intestini TaxID=2017544 RepID=A0ABS5I713_9GAMM|nr:MULTISPECIES: O-antigen ligase family protein [Shewanella]MBR9729125.1 O-antigen ligase family protein [Shewanella intestini]MRG37201.1 hypothetical protein [Shewanella sp. XMDDZSB0408]